MVETYGGGRCAVCQCKTRSAYLMCSRHWGMVPIDVRTVVYDAKRRWDYGGASLEELRSAQALAVQSVTGIPQEPTLEGSEPA